MTMDEQRSVVSTGKVSPATAVEVSAEIGDGVLGERDESRLVEFGFPDEEDLFPWVIITEPEAHEFATPEPGGIEQNDGDAAHLLMQRRTWVRP